MQNAECKMHNKTNKRANPNRQTADLICGAPGGDKKVLAGLCRTTQDHLFTGLTAGARALWVRSAPNGLEGRRSGADQQTESTLVQPAEAGVP